MFPTHGKVHARNKPAMLSSKASNPANSRNHTAYLPARQLVAHKHEGDYDSTKDELEQGKIRQVNTREVAFMKNSMRPGAPALTQRMNDHNSSYQDPVREPHLQRLLSPNHTWTSNTLPPISADRVYHRTGVDKRMEGASPKVIISRFDKQDGLWHGPTAEDMRSTPLNSANIIHGDPANHTSSSTENSVAPVLATRTPLPNRSSEFPYRSPGRKPGSHIERSQPDIKNRVIRRYRCETCVKSYRTKRELGQHIIDKHDMTKSEDGGLVDSAHARQAISYHITPNNIRFANLNLQCEHCPPGSITYMGFGRLDQHKASHHPEKVNSRLQCPVCKTQFLVEGAMAKHALEVCGVTEPWRCPFSDCTTTYEHWRIRQRHIIKVHTRNYACTETGCGRAFVTHIALVDHVNSIHRGLHVHECPGCGGRFAYQRNFVRHQKTCVAKLAEDSREM